MVRSAAPKPPELEDDLAVEVAEFLRWALPSTIPWWHTPNGGSRASREVFSKRQGRMIRISPEAARFKKMGVRAGVPDLTFIMPNGQAAFIELKVGDNTLSDEQIDLRAELIANGCGYQVARSLDEVERILAGWLALYQLKLRARAA